MGAAAISGTIKNVKAVALSGIEVRLWALTKNNKSWAVAKKATSTSSGAYAFTGLTAGTYKLDARLPKGTSGSYTDRWYDIASPSGKGYVGIHADVITLKDGDSLKGYNITLEGAGGLTGTVSTTALKSGIFGRAEDRTDSRIGHYDISQSSYHAGKLYFRGLVPGSYRIYYHGPDGDYETLVDKGPYTVKSGSTTSAKSIKLKAVSADPYEPNNKPLSKGSSINSNVFHQVPPGSYTTSGAMISKRNKGDTDWTCFDVLKGDRLLVEANSTLLVEGKNQEHPWVDPYLVLYHLPSKISAPAKVKEDDDSGTTTFGAKVDTGLIKVPSRYCAMVTTFGDTTYSGTGQGSAGRYTLNIKMGNRQPSLTVVLSGAKYEGTTSPATANYFSVKDGDKVSFTATFSDPDKDTLTASLTHIDSGAKTVTGTTFKDLTGKAISPTGAAFAGGSGAVAFGWEVSQTAAKTSPYELKLQVKDKEYTLEVRFVVSVIGVNNPPSIPVPIAPIQKSIITSNPPTLEIKNSIDVDGDALTYQFEVYQGTSSGTAIQVKTVTEMSGGKTTLALTTLKEDSYFFWRARANDGNASSNYSPWSSFSSFFVDSKNGPPTAPLMVKPADKSVVTTQNPTLSAKNPTDPDEFTFLTVYFQVAEDIGFTQGLFTSPGGVKVNTKGLTTSYTLPKWLAWSKTYFVRAYAKDSHGLQGPYSNINEFKMSSNPNPDISLIDGSTPDAGSGADVGSSDTGGVLDKGSAALDTGGTTGGGEDPGCECRASSGPSPSSGLAWMLLAALALLRRRRR